MNPVTDNIGTELQQALRYLISKVDKTERELTDIKASLQPKFVTVEKFSEATGLDPKQVARYCKEGIIRATQQGKNYSWVILASELARWEDECMRNVKDDDGLMRVVHRRSRKTA